MVTQTIRVNLNQKDLETILAVQSDSLREIAFEFYATDAEDAVQLDPDEYEVKFNVLKPDNNFVMTTFTDGVIKLSDQMTAVTGTGYYCILLMQDDELIYSGNGKIIINDHVIGAENIDSVSEADGYTFPDDFYTKGTPLAVLDDSTTSTTSTWSSSKISTGIAGKASIDDNATNLTETWSSDKIATELNEKPDIDDTAQNTTDTWSSEKINSVVQSAAQIADNVTSTTSTWSSNKINGEINTASTSAIAQLNAMKTGFDGVTYASPAAMVQGEDQKIFDSLKESVFETIGYTEQLVFTAEAGQFTRFLVEANKTYKIENITEGDSPLSSGSLYIDGYSGESTFIPLQGTSKDITFTHSGYLKVYGGVAGTTKYFKFRIEGNVDLDKIKSDIDSINDEISDLKDACYFKDPYASEFDFTGAESALSDVKLTAGITYSITNNTDGISSGLIYIDGYSSVSAYFPAKGNSVNFTPQNTGYLKYYNANVPSGTTVNFTVLGEDVYTPVPAAPELQDEIDVINDTLESMDAATIYEVGVGRTYTSFVDCINALPTSGNKIVKVYPGEYDIYEEMGGDDFVSSMSASSNWWDVNPIIPPNTKVIGIGRVLFKYNCPDNIDDGKAVLLSCLNIRGSSTIENINIECKNLRYAVHVEGSANSDFNNSKYVFTNCNFLRNNGTYRNACVGIGLNYGCEIQFEGCTIDSETTNGNSLLIHGNVEALDGSEKMTIKNCVFLGDYISLQLLVRLNSLAVIPVNIYNTYMQALIYKAATTYETRNDEFSLTLVGCNNVSVTNSNYVTNLRTVNRYNTIGS